MPTDPTIADGPVTETKPAPDYRAALETLERVGTRLVEEWNNINVDGPRGFADVQASIEDMTAALAHARTVIHGQ